MDFVFLIVLWFFVYGGCLLYLLMFPDFNVWGGWVFGWLFQFGCDFDVRVFVGDVCLRVWGILGGLDRVGL